MMTRDFLQRFYFRLSIAGLIIIFAGAGVFIWQTLPPRTIVMATGAEGGANHELGIRYRDILARAGVKLQLLPTSGGVENLERLRDPKSGVDIGFVQGGTTTSTESPNLKSLGTLFFEPLWIFYRGDIGEDIHRLGGRRVSIGPVGSGTHALALELTKRTRVDTIVREFLTLAPEVAAEKLIAGDIDVAFIITAWDSPVVQRLVTTAGIEIGAFQSPDAYLALYPFLHKLILPAGIVDLLARRPAADLVLLAPKASLAVRESLHPALQFLLLNAAVQIHSQPGIFQKAGQFPAAEAIDLPLSDEAQHFYKSGPPFLQNYLPFWMAAIVERMLVVFVPMALLLYPIFKFVPSAYDWFMRLKIMRLYEEMRSVENEAPVQGPGFDAAAIEAKLDQLEQRANGLNLPAAYLSMLYGLRGHIDFVRQRLAKKRR